MKISADTRLLEAADGPPGNLPANWTILYALTKLTDEEFERGIEAGVIYAGMERKDVALLKPPKEQRMPPPVLTGRDLIEQRTIETRHLIVSVLRELNDQEKEEYLSLVRLQLDDLEERRRAA